MRTVQANTLKTGNVIELPAVGMPNRYEIIDREKTRGKVWFRLFNLNDRGSVERTFNDLDAITLVD